MVAYPTPSGTSTYLPMRHHRQDYLAPPARMLTLPEVSQILDLDTESLWNRIAQASLVVQVLVTPRGEQLALSVADVLRLSGPAPLRVLGADHEHNPLEALTAEFETVLSEVSLLEFLVNASQAYSDRLEGRLRQGV